jgi:hypothetical protein
MAFTAKTTASAGVGGNRMFASATLTIDIEKLPHPLYEEAEARVEISKAMYRIL